jgi:hypothetical protein
MSAFNSPAGGGGDAIQAAMARRGMGSPMQTQQGPSAPGFDPGMTPPPLAQGGGPATVVPQGSPAPVPQPQQPGAPVATAMGMQENPEAQLILRALDSRLKALSSRGV